MTHSEALKLALEALGKFSIGYHVDAVELNDLIATLEAALEQPEQEWLTGCPSCGMDGGCDCDEGTYNPMLNAGWGSEQPEQEPVRLQCVHCGTVYTEGVPPAVTEQEPVAWRYKAMIGMPWSLSDDGYYVSCKRDKGYMVEPLYTHPPRREWRGLTEEEALKCLPPEKDEMAFARAIEAALKERNA